MGEYGLSLLKPGMGILTHCNAGTIATAKYGTCLAPIHLGQERGYNFKVFLMKHVLSFRAQGLLPGNSIKMAWM